MAGDFSIADILARGYQQRKDLLSQPTGFSNVAPALGQLGAQAFQVADQNRQRQSVLQAQQDYAKYLATPPDKRDPAMSEAGLRGAMTLGYNPAPPRMMLTPQQIEADAAAKARGTASAKPTGTDQALTPDEMKALRGAMTRKENPLPASMISFRGPRAKLMAQSLMSDPNWSPVSGESGLAAAKAGASAGARLQEGGSAQMTARTANAANAQLDILSEISKKFPRTNVQLMNTPIIKFDAQTMPEAQDWIIALNSFRNEYASALMRGNMPQGQAQEEVARSLPENITPKQLESAIPLLRRELQALVKGQMTRATGKEGQAVAAPSNTSALLDKYGTP